MDKAEILKQLAEGKITPEDASKLLDQVESPRRGTLYCKVSPKGALSLYGLQRMPVTLYIEQWQRLLDYGEEIRTFMTEHDGELKRKDR
ncbi:MAG: SHOCT-like domain-containing protein [Planctomycetota bacterium]